MLAEGGSAREDGGGSWGKPREDAGQGAMNLLQVAAQLHVARLPARAASCHLPQLRPCAQAPPHPYNSPLLMAQIQLATFSQP